MNVSPAPSLYIPKRVVRVGAVSPAALVCPIVGDGSFDFTEVTSVDLFVRKEDGEVMQKVSVAITGQTTAGLTATYVWVAGDIDQLGRWSAVGRLYVVGGYVDTDPETFDVIGMFETALHRQMNEA